MWNLKYEHICEAKQTHRHREQPCGSQGGWGIAGGWTRTFRLTDANYYI